MSTEIDAGMGRRHRGGEEAESSGPPFPPVEVSAPAMGAKGTTQFRLFTNCAISYGGEMTERRPAATPFADTGSRGYTAHMATRVSAAADLDRELLTATDFLDRLEPGRHADLIDGEVFMHSPVSIRHANLLNFVDALMRLYIDRHELGVLYREVVAVRLSGRNVFLPDLAFYQSGREGAIQPTHITEAPDLVVEVLGPRTADRDIGPKFAEYEQHGVREYWILDPETLAHRFYRLEGEELVEYADGAEIIGSEIITGFHLQLSCLDPTALPRIHDALRKLAQAP